MDNYYDTVSGCWVTSADRYHAIASKPPFDLLDDPLLIAYYPEQAWSLMLELLRVVPEDTINYLGAGPLETFICRHGATFIDAIVSEAETNPLFARAALEINLERGMLPELAESRLMAALGPRFRLLDPNASEHTRGQ